MANSFLSKPSLEVRITLELTASLSDIAGPDATQHQALRQAVERGVDEVLTTLGLPGQAVASLDVLAHDDLPGGRFLRIHVNGEVCRYSDALLQRAHSYVTDRLPDPEAVPVNLLPWLRELAIARNDRAVEFLATICVEVVKQRPGVLLGMPQAEAYAAALSEFVELPEHGGKEWSPDPAELLEILRQVLNLRISLVDRSTIAGILQKALAKGRTPPDIAEDLIAALCAEGIELQFPVGHLRQLTRDWYESWPNMFPFLRDGLFVELGLIFPPFRFVPRDDLKQNSFAFRINHLSTLPFISLRPDECLVNETPERLKTAWATSPDRQCLPVANPATGQPCSVIDLSDQDTVEAKGLTTWNQIGYFILCFAEVLRRSSACFVNRQLSGRYVGELQTVFPELIDTVRARVSDEQITYILRALTSEGISVRNLRLIFELTLRHSQSVHPTGRLAFIRNGLQRQISATYMRGTSTLVVYLMDEQIEKLACERPRGTSPETAKVELEKGDDDIIDAVRVEVDALRKIAPTATVPHLLTTIEARPILRDIISLEFPRIAVLSYAEVPPYTNVQPVARIALRA